MLDWLAPCLADDQHAFCKYCKCILKTHRKDLASHAKTKKHKLFVSSKKDIVPVSTYFSPAEANDRKIAELKLAAFVAEHCSVRSIDHLGELIKQIGKDSKTLVSIQLHRTKCTALIKYVLAPAFMKELLAKLDNTYYSLIIDESTSIDTTKVLCLIVKYFDKNIGRVESNFYRLISIESGSAEAITGIITATLKSDGLNINNLLGIGVDGANSMVGKRNSLSTRLKDIVPHMITVKCICHSLHLAAEKAIEKSLPPEIDFIIRETNAWFCHSSKRQMEYSSIYRLIAEKSPAKINKLSGTRWLARYAAIEKILEQWEALDLHFKIAATNEKCFTASILSKMYSNANKLYFIFLKDALKPVIRLNTLFQGDHSDPLKLFDDLQECFLGILKRIIHPDILAGQDKSSIISFEFTEYLMHTETIQMGYAFTQVAVLLPSQELFGIKENCREFFIQLCTQFRQRLPENINIMEKISLFSPDNAQNTNKPDITEVVVHFKNIVNDIDETINEWNNLHLIKWNNSQSNSEQFWHEVGEKKMLEVNLSS